MVLETKRVDLTPETNLIDVLEAVHRDGLPRVIERNGEPLAVISPPDATPEEAAERRKRWLLSFAGIWSDLDADAMIEELYRRRRESPPSPPVEGVGVR